ncbi:Protein phosphatase inhibitor 2 [Cryptosporidium felis]|nr:Protein phosphatase inhibitor 2 [Cryptosporidium felis]
MVENKSYEPETKNNKPKVPKYITWDEDTIAMHDLDRGTRMAIDEPNTPYYHGSSSPSEDEESKMNFLNKNKTVDLEELSSKLFEYSNQVDESKDALCNAAESPPRKSKSDLFKEKRKSHYREYIVAKSKSIDQNDSESDSDIGSD